MCVCVCMTFIDVVDLLFVSFLSTSASVAITATAAAATATAASAALRFANRFSSFAKKMQIIDRGGHYAFAKLLWNGRRSNRSEAPVLTV